MIKSRPASVGEINREFSNVYKTKAKVEHTKAITASYVVLSTDTILVASGTFPVSLPTTVSNYRIIEVNNIGTGTITVYSVSGEYINGESSMALVRYDSMRIIEGSTGWVVI